MRAREQKVSLEKMLRRARMQQHKIESEESFWTFFLIAGACQIIIFSYIRVIVCVLTSFRTYSCAYSRSLGYMFFFYRRSVYKMEFSSSMSSF